MIDRHRRGSIRLRSNVVMADDERAIATAWTLVPGEIVEKYKPHMLSMRGASRRQRTENGYYIACSQCGRFAHRIGREGCEMPGCPMARPLDSSVAVARARHEDALALIEAEQAHLDSAGVETEYYQPDPLPDPEAAVARFLGLEAITYAAKREPAEPPRASDLRDDAAVRERARRALVQAAAETGRFPGSYCESPMDNLVHTLTIGQARIALTQLDGGDGGELKRHEAGSPKFCAAFSSAALAVNTFAPWLGREESLTLAGRSAFSQLAFEVRFPTGLAGKAPNLDVVASGPDAVVAIESKCTEHLGEHGAIFQPSYDAIVDELAHESWRSLFQELKGNPPLLSRLAVGQLIRHYLGLRRAIVDGTTASAVLLYAFWEPDDAAAIPALVAHRRDVQALAERVHDPTVEFAAISYPELWSQWIAPEAPRWLSDHVAALRERYGVTLGEDGS